MPTNVPDSPVTPELEIVSLSKARRWAWATFVVLFSMNLLDYIDRWTLTAVLVPLQREFGINNESAGEFNLWFLLCYSLISPFMGYAGDRFRRTWLLFAGVGVWSIATIGTGLAQTPFQVNLARGVLGIGEATYGVIAPTILMDLFARRSRARVMSAFYLAMPIGGAIGMGLGGWISAHYGWRAAFFVAGAPGLIAAFAALLLPEPIRGASEGMDPEKLKAAENARPTRADYIDLMVNSSYTYSVFGMAAYTFAIGGLAFWLPKFLEVTRGLHPVHSKTILGGTTALAAILGMTLGGWLADRIGRDRPEALFWVPGLAMLGSIPFAFLGLLSTSQVWIYSGIFLAQMLMFVNTGPCNAIIANVVQPNLRAVAYAATLFSVHIFGDVWSPKIMGRVADFFGQADAMRTPFGRLFAALGAVPTKPAQGLPENILAGLLVTIPALLLSGLVLIAGTRHIRREMVLMAAKLRAAARPDQPPARSS